MRNRPPIIEIHGTGTHNRGAQLMAMAIRERLSIDFPGVELVVSVKFGTLQEIADHGFRTTWEYPSGVHRQIDTVSHKFLPTQLAQSLTTSNRWIQKLRSGSRSKATGTLVDPAEIDLVLDASGFAFGDPWGAKPAKRLYEKMSIGYRSATPLVLLPQAVGPFRKPSTAYWCSKLFQRATWVFARDAASTSHARELTNDQRISQCPDFTPLVSHSPLNQSFTLPFVAVVPNYRMIDKQRDQFGYLSFLEAVITHLQSCQQQVKIVLHDTKEDQKVVHMLSARNVNAEVFQASDPRVLKAVLGQARLVVGSRYHALVSAMSQGVPCLVAGWSHKYPELLAEYDCSHCLIADMHNLTEVRRLISESISSPNYQRLVQRIVEAGRRNTREIESMWQKVVDLVHQTLRPNRWQGLNTQQRSVA